MIASSSKKMTAAMCEIHTMDRRVNGVLKFFRWRWVAIAIALLAISPDLRGQIPGLPAKPAETAPAAEKPDATDARHQQWLKEARVAFARVSEPGAETRLPVGVDAAALADYRRDLEQMIIAINRYHKIIATRPDTRKALESARAVSADWKGFNEKPPYSILMLDELINQQDPLREKEASYNSSLALFRRTLSNIQDEVRRAEETSRRIAGEAALDPSEDGAAKWRLDADTAKARVLALRATLLQTNIALLEDQSGAAKLQLELLDRQIATARKKSKFTDDDLTQVKKAAADRQSAVRKEIAGIRKRLLDASAAKTKARTALDEILKSTPEGTPLEQTPELALATVKMEATETRVDSLETVIQMLESLDQLDSYLPDAYQNRKSLIEARSKAERGPPLDALRSAFDLLIARETVATNDLSAVNADIGKQEARASSMAADDPRLLPINDVRASLWDKQAVLQRVLQSVTVQRRMLARWLDEFDDNKVKKSFTEILSETGASTWARFKGLWSIEVFHYNDTVMSGGVPITQQRGVPLGQFFIAILFFLVGYFISNKIKNRLRNTVVRRGHIAEAQAKTLSNWLMIVVGLLLATSTLHFLKIPITVFAFLGGALVIGVGFGTQTLIKNFISGIIVLFERKIRVGDIVDIGGVSGTITEINTRSSVLRGGDGKETLVPNSLFLENRVTNLTLSNRRVRRLVTIRVSTKAPPHLVSVILKECAERHGLILKEPAPYVTLEDIVENANIFGIYYWTEFNDKTNSDVVASDLRFMAEKRIGELMMSAAVAKAEEAPAAKPTDTDAAPPAEEAPKSTPLEE
jgi:potassium-dependent mechanosensitive channel